MKREEWMELSRKLDWETFLSSLENYHHMVYATAYTCRATVWFDFVVPGPRERSWLRAHYPRSWDRYEAIWDRISHRWQEAGPTNEFGVHGSAIVSFCDLCQLVLCEGTPQRNTAEVVTHGGRKYIFCSAPCRWIFEREPERYAGHRDVVKRVLAGEAPANLVALVRRYFGLRYEEWGKDVYAGDYPDHLPRDAAASTEAGRR